MTANTAQQAKFLEHVSTNQLIQAFDLVPDILFWIKDSQSRILHANSVLVEQLGCKSIEQVRGKTDYDFSPKHIAKQFIIDDQKVMAGELITDRLELNLTDKGEFGWFSTTKRPLRDERGNIVGTYGITRHIERTSKALLNFEAIAIPVNYVKEHYAKDISVQQLADIVHLSVSALERRFKKHLGKTPKQFINEIRLERARKIIIETRLPISQIAFQTGFTEPSYFAQQFKKMFGQKPSELRSEINDSLTS
ncbi:MAG: helix-turn-helix domain-containing protein [Kangiellaceae bacterium]|nr:helix-turn-helix domain-containing protein [Kangiellaceae bacterium]